MGIRLQELKAFSNHNKKQIIIFIFCLSLLGFLLFCLIPQKAFVEDTYYDKTDQTIGELVNGTDVEQIVSINKKYDEIRIFVATYNKVLKNGSLVISLVDKENGSIFVEKIWQAADIKDNTFLNLPIDVKEGKYFIRIHSDGFSAGNSPTLFLSGNGKDPCLLNGVKQNVAIALSLGIQQKSYNINAIFFLALLVIISGCYFTSQYGRDKIRKAAYYVLALIFIITGSVFLAAYQTIDQWNPQMLYRLMTYQIQNHRIVDFVINDFNDRSEFNYDYRFDGSIKTIYKSIHFYDLNDNVLVMTLYMEPDSRKQQYDFSLYFNKEGSFDNRQQVSQTFYGQDKMYIVLQEQMPVREIRLDAGYTEDIEKLDNNVDFFMLKKVVINDSHYITDLQKKVKTYFLVDIIITLIILIALALWKRFRSDKYSHFLRRCNFSPVKSFIFFGLLFGIIFTFTLPIFQAPDEPTHLRLISEELGYRNLDKKILAATSDMDVIRLIGLSGERVDSQAYFGGMNNKITQKVIRDSFQITPQVIRHLPQDIGIEIGLKLGLPAYWILILGRLTAFVIYLLFGVMALRLMPIKRTLLTTLMLCPMMIQQVASLSYDSFLISLSMLFISYILHLKYKVVVKWKELLIPCILLIAIFIIKMPYALLAGLILIIPLDNIKISSLEMKSLVNYKKLIFIINTILIMLITWIVSKIIYGKVVYAFLFNPEQSLRLLINTIYINWNFYAKSLAGNFGWLDTPVSQWFVLFIFIIVGISAFVYEDNRIVVNDRITWRVWDKFIIGVVFIGIVLLFFIFMIVWTFRVEAINMGQTIHDISQQLCQINIIKGVQGRYFLPIILLPLITIKSRISNRQQDFQLLRCIGIISIILYTTSILLNRYWIV